MRKRLIDLALWSKADRGDPETDLEAAWKVLSRLGHPCRYVGSTVDGELEWLVSETGSGRVLAVGRGRTLPLAICRAAVMAKTGAGNRFPAPRPTPSFPDEMSQGV